MNVAYIGNFGPAHSTENHYAVSFEAAGHNVLRLQEDRMPSAARATIGGNAMQLLLYTRTWDCLSEEWREMVEHPPEGVVSAAVHLDIWWGLEREHEVREQAMFKAQHVFTADGDHEYEWRTIGVNHHWLPPGVVDLSLVGERLGTPSPKRWDFDVAFVGSRAYHPEHPRAELIDALRDEFGDRFVHVGHDGDNGYRMVRQELNDFYATVPVIVGDSLGAHLNARYWSDRFYETWGRGGFLVFPAIDRLDTEVGLYPSYDAGDLKSMIEQTHWWLDNPTTRRHIRTGRVVRNRCTYTRRAAQIVETIAGA